MKSVLEYGKIGGRQFFLLVITFTIGSSILVAPSGLAHEAKQDAWISAILSVVISLLFVLLYNALGKRYPQKNLVEYSEMILGKWLGKIVALSFLSYFFILAALLLREIGDFLTTQIMPDTPIQSIHIIFAAVVIMGTRMGLEPLTRTTEIFFPWVIILFLLMVILLTPQIEFENMQPFLGEGLKPILKASFPFLGLPFLELVVLLMIFPYVNHPLKAGKFFLIGMLMGGIVLIIIVLITVLVIGADQAGRQIYPSYNLAKKINIGDILQRMEAVMAGIWFITIFIKITICFYASSLGLAQVLNLKDFRFLTFPLGMILIALSLEISPHITYFKMILAEIWTPYSLTFGLFLPLLLLGVDMVNKKFSK